MQQISSTLIQLMLYLGVVALGAVLGGRCPSLPYLPKLQTIALLILITTLGAELGSNQEIVSSLSTIGVQAIAITLASMVGSLLAVSLLRRGILKLNAQGETTSTSNTSESDKEKAVHLDHSLTLYILCSVVIGMFFGYFVLPDAAVPYCKAIIQFGLYLLLFLVGVDMGQQGGLYQQICGAGFRVLIVPVAAMVGTFAMTAVVGLFLPLSIKDCVAASAGFGWYTLAPTLLAPYSLTVSATAFLSNILHELFSIVAVPIVAKRFGYLEAVALPGATAMDTVLPVVVNATSERMAVYSFASGAILSLAVPILVPIIVSLPF